MKMSGRVIAVFAMLVPLASSSAKADDTLGQAESFVPLVIYGTQGSADDRVTGIVLRTFTQTVQEIALRFLGRRLYGANIGDATPPRPRGLWH